MPSIIIQSSAHRKMITLQWQVNARLNFKCEHFANTFKTLSSIRGIEH